MVTQFWFCLVYGDLKPKIRGYLCFGDANTGVGGDIGVFGGQEKDAGDEIGIDLSRVLTRLLPAPTQMDSDGLRWAQWQ